MIIDVATDPNRYRHWRVDVDGRVATVTLQVDPAGGLRPDYELKLNTYDLGVDIELADIVQRLLFEHPEVAAVVLTSGLEKVFCAGANIQMLAGASHHHKVAFCKFTNETRCAIEDACLSGQIWIAALNGTAAGGGYELAMACDEIVLIDDGSSTVSLPEVPLLAVLPGTGGLTRLVDKRMVRRDRADVFATRAEGMRGEEAVHWRLIDACVPRSMFHDVVRDYAEQAVARSDRPAGAAPIVLGPLDVETTADGRRYEHVTVTCDRAQRAAHIIVAGPAADDVALDGWLLAACRQLDDAMLHLRFNEPELGTWVLRTTGDPSAITAVEAALDGDALPARDVRRYWARTLRRLDLSARTLVALIEPGSCFAGVLAELALAADRSYMLDGTWPDDDRPAAVLQLTEANGGWFPMVNGLSRVATRFWGLPTVIEDTQALVGKELLAADAADAGLVTFTPDDLDWDDEVRLCLEERASFSPDALTGMEANFRARGPGRYEAKIFDCLTPWQNWIFQRPNAVGPEGALRRYGSGSRPAYDRNRT